MKYDRMFTARLTVEQVKAIKLKAKEKDMSASDLVREWADSLIEE